MATEAWRSFQEVDDVAVKVHWTLLAAIEAELDFAVQAWTWCIGRTLERLDYALRAQGLAA